MTFTTLARTVRTQYLPALRQQAQAASVITYPVYDPCNEKVAEFHNTRIKVRVLFGGNRAGKTTSGAYELLPVVR